MNIVAAPTSCAPGWPAGWSAGDLERLANTGGPSSRQRTERFFTTVLGQDEGAVRCPRVLRVGLDFGRRNPLKSVLGLLEQCGFADEGEARAALALPIEPCLCRIDPAPRPAPVGTLSPTDALYHALVLGLSTPWVYDPARPVTWTTASLTRQLELFDGRGFYA
jgi:hypothetical protein